MGSSNPLVTWFGNLKLAYKYAIVFLVILFLTILFGFIKVLMNRRKLNKAMKTEAQKGVVDNDNVELNLREKDEGDLFGIRAIEAGFFAGVAQSRPTSRRNSVTEKNPSGPSIAGGNSPFLKAHSANNSVHSLSLGAGHETGPQRAMSPLPSKLRPSEAELSGRRNHNGTGEMSLHVPPPPGHPRGPPSPTFGGFDSDGDGSSSPRSADFNPERYTPAHAIPMPDSPQVSYHSGNDIKSQSASFNASPSQSPTPSPGAPPSVGLPTLPSRVVRKGSRSPSPESFGLQERVYQPSSLYGRLLTNDKDHEPEPSPLSPTRHVQAQTSAPSHKRDDSDASLYSNVNRLSAFQAYQAYQQHMDRSISPALSDELGGTSMVVSVDKGAGQISGRLSSYLVSAPELGGTDSRLSDFYDTNHRQSQLGRSPAAGLGRPVDRQSTIMEVDSPMPSPLFPRRNQPGTAF